MSRVDSVTIEEALAEISPILKARMREYYRRREVKARMREYRRRHEVKARRQECAREYYRRHAEELKAKRRAWRALPLSEKRRRIEEKYGRLE